MNYRHHNCTTSPGGLLAFSAALLVFGAAARGQGTLLILTSGDSPHQVEVVKGFLNQWNTQASDLRVQQVTLDKEPVSMPAPAAVVSVGIEATRWALQHTDGPVVFCLVANARQNLLANLNENDRQRLRGVSLNVSVKTQFQEIQELLPTARRVGVIYDPQKSPLAIQEARQAATDLGLTLIERPVESEAALPEATAWIGPRVDVLWAPLDATVFQARNAQFVLMRMLQHKVPVFGFSENMAQAGALAAPRADYTAVGQQTAELLASVLEGTGPAGGIMQQPKLHDLVVNQRIGRLIGKPIASPSALRIRFIDEE